MALITQALLATHSGLASRNVVLVSLIASLTGLLGARVYYLALHRDRAHGLLTIGMCIQGFIVSAIATLIIGALMAGIPVGELLDVTAPGLLLAMMIGRWGCFPGGCCAGRPTGSRWALWSSDRRLGTRRIPTQLYESAIAGALAIAALPTLLLRAPRPAGTLFVATIAAYTLGRQFLFPFATSHARRPAEGRSSWSPPRSSLPSTS